MEAFERAERIAMGKARRSLELTTTMRRTWHTGGFFFLSSCGEHITLPQYFPATHRVKIHEDGNY